jgi:thymidine phosphorylase
MLIDTYDQPVVYMSRDCPVCRSEGWQAEARVLLAYGERKVIATLNVSIGDILAPDEAGLSEAAWRILGASEGELVTAAHPPPLTSLGHLRKKIYGGTLAENEISEVIADITAGRFSAIEMAAYVTAFAGGRTSLEETVSLTRAMIAAGDKLQWDTVPIVDKHSVGGLPGNRTTMVVVPIVAAAGCTMPKTSSRAITSPAGTADAMETVAPVDLDVSAMRRVVDSEGACIVWGGAVRLSPADDIIIRVERPLDIDSDAQLVASVLSKKAAAGSSHVVIDMPVGPTAKVRSPGSAERLGKLLEDVAGSIGLSIRVLQTDGSQPVGRGIGPALEARDVLSVLRLEKDAPRDLRVRAITIAANILELAGAEAADCESIARAALESGAAMRKFEAICRAQGGMREPAVAELIHVVESRSQGTVRSIDNRRLARTAKLAGAPAFAAAGVQLHAPVGTVLEKGQPIFSIHSGTPGELQYALDYAIRNADMIGIRSE